MIINKRPAWIWLSSILIIILGLISIKSAAGIIFFNNKHISSGNYVDFVLWFNFIAGFFYLLTGLGLWFKRNWSLIFSMLIALFTLLIFLIFILYILFGGVYERQTILALFLRSIIWLLIAGKGYYILNNNNPYTG